MREQSATRAISDNGLQRCGNDVTVSAYAAWLISSSASARARNEMHYLGETAENVSADVELLCRESNTTGRVEDFDWNCCALFMCLLLSQ
jgi:hypothetical protein